MSDSVRKGSDTITGVLMTLAIGWLVYHAVEIVDVWLHRLAGQTASKMDDMLAPLVRKSLRVTIVVLTLVQVAQIVSDQPITSILAGLSVGGLAIGLAAKDTVSNFFGSLVILADKPFELGDRVVIDGHDGPVEEVGFRSTKLRTLDGHLVSIPNGTLANMTIQNIGKRPNIKRAMNLGVTYDTPPEKIERALAIVKELLQDHEGIRPEMPPRVYFSDLKADSLNISAIYWYHPADYWAFMDFSEKLNLQILQRFAAEGIEFAFPTQTVHLAGGAAPGFAGKSEV
jgi:MscS family membrane protein